MTGVFVKGRLPCVGLRCAAIDAGPGSFRFGARLTETMCRSGNSVSLPDLLAGKRTFELRNALRLNYLRPEFREVPIRLNFRSHNENTKKPRIDANSRHVK